jgi:hypothetical protein
MSERNRSMESLLLGGGRRLGVVMFSSSSGDESDGGSVSSGSSTREVVGNVARMPPPHPRGSAAVESSGKEKRRARIFIRVLLKYLERKDPGLHGRVRAVVARCKNKNRARVPGYESVTARTKARLRKIVSDAYWTRVEAYTRRFVATRNNGPLEDAAGGGGGRSSAGPADILARATDSRALTRLT